MVVLGGQENYHAFDSRVPRTAQLLDGAPTPILELLGDLSFDVPPKPLHTCFKSSTSRDANEPTGHTHLHTPWLPVYKYST